MRNRLYVLLIIFGVVLIFILFPLFLFRRTNLSKVVVIGNISNINGLNLLNNQNLIFLDEEQVAQKLLESNIAIEDILLEKNYPNSLILQIRERKPIAQIIFGNQKIYYDKDGIILEGVNISYLLPLIKVDSITLSKSKKTDWRIMKAIKILEDFARVDINIDNIFVSDKENTFFISLVGSGQAIIPYEGDIPTIAASLQIILQRFRIEGKIIEKIDFRFEKPTVVLENGEKISSIIKK